MTKVAIIGGGASGIAAASGLRDAGLDVTIFESEGRLGGHCLGAEVPDGDGGFFAVDLGVSDFNQSSFNAVRRFLQRLGLTWHPVVQDAAFALPDGTPVWSLLGGERIPVAPFADWDRFVADDARFRNECLEVLSDPRLADWTAARWLQEFRYGDEFVERAFVPRAGGAFPMPDLPPTLYLMRSIVGFWHMHGILGPNPPTRMVVDGGMHRWPDVFARAFVDVGGKLALSTRVLGLARRRGGVRLRVEDGDGRHATHLFDHVVCATSPNVIAGILEDPTHEEWSALGGFHWQRARVCVHGDERLLGNVRELRGAYNYVIGTEAELETRPTISFWSNRLASLPPGLPDVYVTVNPHLEPDPAKVWADRFFVHPCLERARDRSAERLDSLQGHGNVWYAGAWLRAPHVHEQALRTGLEVGQRMVEALRQPRHAGARCPTWEDTIRKAPAFVALDEVVLEELRVEAGLRTLARGELLFAEGDAADAMYVLARGRLTVERGGAPFADAVPGDLIGELALLDRGTRTATAIAAEPCTLWRLEHARFEALCADGRPAAGAVTDQVAREVCHRLRMLLRVHDERNGAVMPSEEPDAGSPVEPVRFVSLLQSSIERKAIPANAATGTRVSDARCFQPGECLVSAGARLASSWLVLEGELERFTAGGRPVGSVAAGELAGTVALLDGGRQPLTLRARTDLVVLPLSPEEFRRRRYESGGSAWVSLAHRSLARVYRMALRTLDLADVGAQRSA